MPRPGARLWTGAAALVALVATLLPPPVEAAAPLVSPSGAGTVVIGPQAMEGNLQIHPGDTVRAGFDFTMPGSHPAATASFYNGYVSLLVTCADGSAPPLTIQLPSQTIVDPAGSPNWYPSGDQSNSLVYQGSLTAPDLCGGGVMNDASGALFTITFFSTDTIDKVNFRFHYSDNTSGSWSATIQGTPTPFAKTVTSATLTPTLSLGLTADHTTAIPGDTINYTATVTNIGATLKVGGDFLASDTGSATTTIASYWDAIYTSVDGTNWIPLVGTAATASGYTPAVGAPSASGLALSLTNVAASGVTYPNSSDPILGTTLTGGSTAQWHYSATATLSAAQAASLFDTTKVKKIRNSFHLEVSPANPNVAQPAIANLDFSTLFYAGGASASLTNVTIGIQSPQGAVQQFNSTTTPALASLGSGVSASVTGTFHVPAAAAKTSGQTDSSYFSALSALEGTLLKATASATATASTGTVNAAAPPAVVTVEHLPIVSITKSGPATANAGTIETNPLSLNNSGGATASGLAITDTVPNGANGTVTGIPATLVSGATASATASYPVPGAQAPGNLTDTASVTWQDANGNTYGPVSSSFTTNVANPFAGATLTLSPPTAGPNAPGTSQSLTATLLDANKQPVANQTITFAVTGANPTSSASSTDAHGNATFSYTGANVGTDVVQATFSAPGTTLSSNTSSVSWTKLLQTAATAVVQGNFFANPNNSCTFDIGSGATPVFSQSFPDILFNPDPSAVPHDISSVNNFTRPFTDLTVDVNGNYNGQIVAQGNGLQAGNGSLTNFWAEFTGGFVVSQPGDLTFTINHDDGYILGVGGGATRVNGDLNNNPATTPFNGYGVVAAWNVSSTGSSSSGPATVHFPAAGTYPYELDYTECGGGALFLQLLSSHFTAQTSPLSIYVGYADGLRAGGSAFPFPWNGSPGTTFEGCTQCIYDGGAIRIDNSGSASAAIDSITVDIPIAPGVTYCPTSTHFDIWPHNLTIPAGQTLILAPEASGTSCSPPQTFDTSDTSFYCGPNTGIIPLINVTSGGVTTTFKDTKEILNTGGRDLACDRNESTPWQRIGGGGTAVNLPLPPAATLDISPFNVQNALLGQAQTLTVSAMDGGGNPVANLPVTLQVFGPNAQTLTGTTTAAGQATFAYVGALSGTDNTQASAFITGLRVISNLGSVAWSPPIGGGPNPPPNPNPNAPPPPSITTPNPADGAVVTKPVPVSATITPPSGQTITAWRVLYQAQDPGPVVTLNSGSGTPPATLATFDPTQLPNDTYTITIEATATGGGIQDLSTTVTVYGNLKVGRYVTTYQDISVPVNGFQMEVRRTYDSIDKSPGDFGVGWRVSVSNFRIAPNRVLGAGGWTQYNSSCAFGLCFTAFKNSAPRFVTVTFPDQHTEAFDFTPQGGTNVFWSCTPQFTARAAIGTTSTLVPVDDTTCSYLGDGNLYGSNGLYSPNRFKLTTSYGTVLILDRTLGLISETDRNGNTLTVDSNGLHSSSGQSITFTRDSSNRITQIAGPSSQSLTYAYSTSAGSSSSGDLSSVTDSNGNVTKYIYDPNHDLLQAVGPGGQPLQAEQYDASGRLVAITDANGNTAQVTNNVAGQQETVIDPLGKLTTVLTLDDRGDLVRQDLVFGGKTLTTTATYDSVGRPLSRSDPLGHKWTATYDANGNVLSITDPMGRAMNVTYDSFGAPLAVADAAGATSAYVYGGSGNLVTYTNPLGQSDQYSYSGGLMTKHTDALGRSWTYGHDGAGNITSITDSLGHTSSWTYDTLGHITTSTDARGGVTTSTYDANGNLLTVTDPLGNVTKLAYNGLNELVSRIDPLGKTTKYTYDGNRAVTSVTDPLGNVTKYSYDADGRLNTVTDPAGGATTYSYDGAGRLVSQQDSLGRITSFAYDDSDRLVSKTMPNSGVVTYSYDAAGHQVAVADPLGNTNSYGYDTDGRLVSIADPLKNTTTYTLDSLGREIAITDPLGGRTQRSYDAAGELLSVTDQLGGATTYGYDSAGNRTSITDPLGHAATYQFDGAGNVTSVMDALGRTTTFTYDADGHLTSTVQPSGVKSSSTYDADGRLASVADGLGDTTSYGYDDAGRPISVTNPLGGTTTYSYDPTGRQTSMTDALGGKVTTTYDLAGQQTSVVNARGDVTAFTYDPLGDVLTRTNPAMGTTTLAYDLAGRMNSKTDGRGVTVTGAYDAAGNLTGITFPGGSISQGFDALGRRTSMTDATGTTTFGFDAASRLTSVAGPQGTVGYGYDSASNRTSLSIPGRGATTYAYDAANQLTTLTDWAHQVFSFSETPDGLPATISRPGRLVTTYGYDGADRLTSVHHDGASGPIVHFDYTLDASGNRTSMTTSAGTETYTFDVLNRVDAVSYPNGDKASYTYDAAGNRLTSTLNGSTTSYTYDSTGRLVSRGPSAVAYDAGGNVTADGSSTYTWDWAGRLAASTVNGITTSYTYDGDGIRVATTVAGSTVNYVWDRSGSLPLLVSDGTQGYVQTDQGVLEQLGITATYPLADALGSVRSVATPSATVAGATSYDAFGGVRSQSGQQSPVGFAGEQTDSTGLTFLRARYYDPTSGRFISPDSVQPNNPGTQGFDLYSYAANNPATQTDPSGNQSPATDYGINLERDTEEVQPLEQTAEGPVSKADLAQCVVIASASVVTKVPTPPPPGRCGGPLVRLFIIILAAVAVAVGVAVAAYEYSRSQAGNQTSNQSSTGENPGTAVQPQPEPTPEPPPAPINDRGKRCSLTDLEVPFVLAALQAEAESIHSLADPIRYKNQTVASIKVRQPDGSCIDIIGGSGSGLQPKQRAAVTALGAELALGYPQNHAEVTVLNNLAGRPPLVLGISIVGNDPKKGICDQTSTYHDSCRTDITTVVRGLSTGRITDDQKGAVWEGNLP